MWLHPGFRESRGLPLVVRNPMIKNPLPTGHVGVGGIPGVHDQHHDDRASSTWSMKWKIIESVNVQPLIGRSLNRQPCGHTDPLADHGPPGWARWDASRVVPGRAGHQVPRGYPVGTRHPGRAGRSRTAPEGTYGQGAPVLCVRTCSGGTWDMHQKRSWLRIHYGGSSQVTSRAFRAGPGCQP